ncbi:DUF6911 family protein [Herbaspirillum huttiense]|uniref:DUF6911 family protein n=1 Tax=Herbaspirillum huttiense TaxID=863372 RepID=UPI0031D87BBD
MRKETSLGGFVIDAEGIRHQLPIILNPHSADIEGVLNAASVSGKGILVMRRKPAPEFGPYELTVYIDSGYFLLMLNINEDDGGHGVGTISNENMPNNLMVILGEKFPARAVTRDAGFVCSAFGEFANTGNVSMDRYRSS